MSLEGHSSESALSDQKANLSYKADASKSYAEGTVKSCPIIEESVSDKKEKSESVQGHDVTQQQNTAKIHDFCFGIPYGGLVLTGGLVDFIFSRNLATFGTNVLCGGALLTFSSLSLKKWRQGKSSLPFILGQTVLSASLLWKNLQTYSSLKKVLPSWFYIVISAAMLFFYSYVVISGGNPPPKKKFSTKPST